MFLNFNYVNLKIINITKKNYKIKFSYYKIDKILYYNIKNKKKKIFIKKITQPKKTQKKTKKKIKK